MGITQSLKEAGVKLGLLKDEDGQQADKPDDKTLATRPLITPRPARPEDNRNNNQPEGQPGSLASDWSLVLSSEDPIETIYQRVSFTQPDFTAEHMLEILDLVSDEPAEKRSQKVELQLKLPKKKYGTTPQSIQQDAARKYRILSEFVKAVSGDLEKEIAKKQSHIDTLQKEIDKAKQEIEQKRQAGAKVRQLCLDRAKRLKEVVDYFGGDVSASD